MTMLNSPLHEANDIYFEVKKAIVLQHHCPSKEKVATKMNFNCRTPLCRWVEGPGFLLMSYSLLIGEQLNVHLFIKVAQSSSFSCKWVNRCLEICLQIS